MKVHIVKLEEGREGRVKSKGQVLETGVVGERDANRIIQKCRGKQAVCSFDRRGPALCSWYIT